MSEVCAFPMCVLLALQHMAVESEGEKLMLKLFTLNNANNAC